MAKKKTKLELTWIGKNDRPRLEPRILLEDPEQSYAAEKRVSEGDIFCNTLIQGDNLLALKALEQEFSSRFKCAYIDPPFNTGQAFEHYDDGIEHSLWLSLMRDRLELLRVLLAEDGTLFVHIDETELGYLLVLLDEVFGRANRVSVVTFKQGSATGHKAINPGCVTTTNYIVVYARNKPAWKPNRLFTARDRDTRYNQFITNVDSPLEEWNTVTLMSAFSSSLGVSVKAARETHRASPEKLDDFVLRHAKSVIRFARPDYKSVSKAAQAAIDASQEDPGRVHRFRRDGFKDLYLLGGQRILFYKDKLKLIDGEAVAGEPLTNLWDDILSNNLHKEGGVKFPKGKKPEALIKRILELTTSPGDWVLDSFAGSGTTGAVAHKMGRPWVMVELGEHCTTHILPRLRSVVDGTDTSGITKAVTWKGGGGFRYAKLAPSLLELDKWGNWVISRTYNGEMLAEAMCKLQGFTYSPSSSVYWQHGQSTERDFIYVTTQTLTHEQLQVLSTEVGSDRTLLICCSAFRADLAEFSNLTVTKIPATVLSRCEWGRDDYSLNVESILGEELPTEPDDDGVDEPKAARAGRKAPAIQEMTLFGEAGEQ